MSVASAVIPAQAGIQYGTHPRSGQHCKVVPLAREFFNSLDSGLRRNDAAGFKP
jgi:hypothetical protein